MLVCLHLGLSDVSRTVRSPDAVSVSDAKWDGRRPRPRSYFAVSGRTTRIRVGPGQAGEGQEISGCVRPPVEAGVESRFGTG